MHPRSSSARRALPLARALLLPFAPALWAYTLYRRRILHKSAASTRGMWGRLPPEARRALRQDPDAQEKPVVWMHAVSVGEVMAARVVARALRQVLEEQRIGALVFLSLTTDTGMEAARAALLAGEVDAVGFYPIDSPVAVRRALNAVRPSVFVALETELWPLFLLSCRARGVRTLLANGRVSDRLQRDGARLRWVFAPMMRGFDALLMRSAFDAERARALAPGAAIFEAGDVKLDAAQLGRDASQAALWKQVLGIENGQDLWVAGSTHAGEEEIVARAYADLKREFPALRLLLAPRHIERADEVVALLRGMDLPAVLRSRLPASSASTCSVPDQAQDSSARDVPARDSDAIIVLDTVGELAQVYAASEVAFVGGSLIRRGGHNLLEPVLRGVPVAFGPNVANFRVAAALAEEHGLGRMVSGQDELSQAIAAWLRERSGDAGDAGDAGSSAQDARDEFAERASRAIGPHRGASRRVALAIARALRGHSISIEV